MSEYFGDFAEDATVLIPFNTFTSDDPAASSTITNLADGDIKVHKDGGTTEIATDGATVAIDFDGITGNHLVTIDTSVHADYSVGSDYLVRMEGTTVDGGTINAWLGSFSIENRTTFPKADFPTNFAALGIESDGDLTKVNTLHGHTAQTGDSFARLAAPAGASVSADIAAIKAETAVIVADTNELQTDNVPGLIAALNDLSAAEVNAQVDTALADYDGPTKAEMDSGFAALNDPTAAAIADAVLDEALSGHTGAGSLGKAVADIEVDTNELQGDWVNGGRLDLLLDAVKAVTDVIPDSGALTTITSNVAAILADTGTDGVLLATGALDAAALSTDAVDEIWTKAITELSTAMPATPTIVDVLAFQHMAAYNLHATTRSSGYDLIYNDAGSLIFGAQITQPTTDSFQRAQWSTQ